MQKQSQQRHHQDIQRGDEAGFSHRGVQQAKLLEGAPAEEQQATDPAAAERAPRAGRGHAPRGLRAGAAQGEDGQERESGEGEAAGLHGEGADVFHSGALGDEARAPDHGGEQEQQGAAQLFSGVHGRTSQSYALVL